MKSLTSFHGNTAFIIISFLAGEIHAQTTIWSENFTYADGTNQGSGSPPKWTINTSDGVITPPDDWFDVRSNRMEGRDVDGTVEWLSEIINISEYFDIHVSADLSETGTMETSDFIHIYYILDGRSEKLFSQNGDNADDFTSCTASQSELSGSTLQIIIRLKNNAGTEYHQFDNIIVQGEVRTPKIEIRRPAGVSIANGGTDNIGNRCVGNIGLNYTVDNRLGTKQLDVHSVTGSSYNNVDNLANLSLPPQISPGTSDILNVSFTVGTGAFSFILHINNSDSNENPYDIQIIGTGTLPEINIKQDATDIPSGGSYNFGITPVHGQNSTTFIIDNTGLADLKLHPPLILSGSNSVEFHIHKQPASVVSGSGGATSFVIQFKPESPGTKTANVAVLNNDTDENPYDITLYGNGIDTSPKISRIDDQDILEDTATDWIPFTLSDPDTDPLFLTLSAGTDDQTLLPNQGIALKGSGSNRFIKVTPGANQSGTGLVYITVADDLSRSRRKFRVSVIPVNDPPCFTCGFDSISMTQGERVTIPIDTLESCVVDIDNEISNLRWTVKNNTHIGCTCSDDTITFTSPTDWSGTENLILKVSDGDLYDTATLVVAVQSAEPSIKQTEVQDNEIIATKFSLDQNFPNPFNPVTNISYSLPVQTHVRMEIYNMYGQKVTVLENGIKSSGIHTATWNASNASTGIYLYRISTPQFTVMRKCMLVK